jgi:response regulator RpfG family c-di-GMP phosphodiesterase
MPGMSDIELIANIKKLEPKVKAMFITAFDKDHIKPELEKYDYQIVEIFQKPLSIKDLSKRVKNI